MSLDPRSRERLEALGRRLPQPLPPPPPAATPSPAAAPRHRLEVEDNPEQLFRELMAASPDGTVPAHHLERLRQLEGQRADAAAPASRTAPPERGAPSTRAAAGRPGPGRSPQPGGQDDLYAAFSRFLNDEDDD
jgi:hypothetical protein